MDTDNDLAGWIGVDLDGVLARYGKWRGIGYIGQPIKYMVDLVKYWLEQGIDVRIFTARVQEGEEAIKVIEAWCEKHIGQKLPVTNVKDFSMVYLFDDRAIAMEPNTGRFLSPFPNGLEIITKQWWRGRSAPPLARKL